jgi:hypothetical protein
LGVVFDSKMAADKLRVTPADRSRLIINCPWSTPKINADSLQVLRRIVDGVFRKYLSVHAPPPHLHFRFSAALGGNQSLALAVLQAEIQSSIQGSVFPHLVSAVVVPASDPGSYLVHAAAAHLALDAFPFGGCNTVMASRRG